MQHPLSFYELLRKTKTLPNKIWHNALKKILYDAWAVHILITWKLLFSLLQILVVLTLCWTIFLPMSHKQNVTVSYTQECPSFFDQSFKKTWSCGHSPNDGICFIFFFSHVLLNFKNFPFNTETPCNALIFLNSN